MKGLVKNGIYRDVTSNRILDWLPLVRCTFKQFWHRQGVFIRKGEESAIKKLYPGGRIVKHKNFVCVDEINKEIYERQRKWQIRRTPIVRSKIEVPVEYSFNKTMFVHINPLKT